MELKMKNWDSTWWGIAAGLLGTILGFTALAIWWSVANSTSISYFIQTVFWQSGLYKDSILTVSVLFNVGLFWMALRYDLERLARGIMVTILISVPIIIWVQSTAYIG